LYQVKALKVKGGDGTGKKRKNSQTAEKAAQEKTARQKEKTVKGPYVKTNKLGLVFFEMPGQAAGILFLPAAGLLCWQYLCLCQA
jgi:hypothetical protein